MKIKSFVLFVVTSLVAIFSAPLVHAQAVVAPAAVTAVAAPSPVSHYLAEILPLVLAVLGPLVAIWKQGQLNTLQKVARSVVMGVETATQIPEVQKFESTVKDTIHAQAVKLGVADDLHSIVQNFTASAPASTPPAA